MRTSPSSLGSFRESNADVCRLLAYVGSPQPLAPLVFGGDHSLYRQSWQPRELLSGSVNADGYGVVWYSDGRPGRIAEARPIWYDEDLERTLGVIESGCVIAALRNGTPGIPVDRSGLLPMVHGRWSFVLNGFVPDFRRSHMRALRSDLPDDLYGALVGSSDSETLFLLAIRRIQEGSSMIAALVDAASRVKARVGSAEAQLTMVMTDGDSVAAVRTGTARLTNSLYVAKHPPLADGGIVLASEAPETGGVWAPVDEHTSVEIRADGTVTTERVFLD